MDKELIKPVADVFGVGIIGEAVRQAIVDDCFGRCRAESKETPVLSPTSVMKSEGQTTRTYRSNSDDPATTWTVCDRSDGTTLIEDANHKKITVMRDPSGAVQSVDIIGAQGQRARVDKMGDRYVYRYNDGDGEPQSEYVDSITVASDGTVKFNRPQRGQTLELKGDGSIISRNSSGQIKTIVDATGRTTEIQYNSYWNSRGQLVNEETPARISISDADSKHTITLERDGEPTPQWSPMRTKFNEPRYTIKVDGKPVTSEDHVEVGIHAPGVPIGISVSSPLPEKVRASVDNATGSLTIERERAGVEYRRTAHSDGTENSDGDTIRRDGRVAQDRSIPHLNMIRSVPL